MARKRKHRPSSSGILLFIVGFVGCLLLCAAAGYVWWKTTDPQLPWLPSTAPTETVTTAPTKDNALYHPSDRFAHAVYITDNHGKLQSLSLITVCPDTLQITVAGIPVELHLSATDNADTLARRFRLDGVEKANEALVFALPSTPQYYSVLSYDQIEQYFLDIDAKLDVSLAKDIDEAAEDGSYSVHLAAGDHALTPTQITNLMRCTEWQGGRRERADMHALLVQSYVAQFVSTDRQMAADYKVLCAQSDTNLPEERFSTVSPIWQYMALSQGDNSPALLPITGVYNGTGATLRFTLTTDFYERLVANWRPDETVMPSSNESSPTNYDQSADF